MTVLLCGIQSEGPLVRVREELEKMNAEVIMFNQRHFEQIDLDFQIANGVVTGNITVGGTRHNLEEISGVYMRLMDDRFIPEIRREVPNSYRRLYCRTLHDVLIRWCEIAPVRVVNRMQSMASNSSKPYQSQLIVQHGFNIPDTLITNDPAIVRDFAKKHGKVIYKSMSGMRSIVQILEEKDLCRLQNIRWCPVQFQKFVDGTNVRVHSIGDQVFATSLFTDATDYRYAHRAGYNNPEMKEVNLSSELSQRCIGLSKSLGLDFAGIDLKIASDGRVYCFEVNPSPAFNYYEAGAGQPIANAVAKYLTGEDLLEK
jgi:glutathione synthase/RimK-type ligase-like ATP-grasp enzyme